MLGVGGTTLSWLLATSGQNQPSPTAQETTRRPLISLLILEVARGQGWRQEKATRIRVEALGAGRTSSSKGPARPPGAGGAGMGWQGRGPPRDRGNLRYPERKGKARGEGAGLGHQSCLSWSWDFRPTGSKAPSPSQELSPQERRWPAAGCTQISRRPGEGHWRALGLLGVLRVPALQVAQVDGLEGCRGTEWSVVGAGGEAGSVPCPALASESPGIQATPPGCLGSSRWVGLPAPWSAPPA